MRYRGLDGLRGLAALTVVIAHLLMTDGQLAGTWVDVRMHGWRAWLTYSPLHLLWAGQEAVDLFFVLSGFVLCLPFLDNATVVRWVRYYPQRLARLILPIWAAVAAAVILAWLVPRSAHTSSWWLASHAGALNSSNVRQAAEIVRGSNGLNTALWSMQWEVLFSLLLPVAVVVVTVTRRLWLPALVAAAAASGWGVHTQDRALCYFAMFAVGTFLAVGRDQWQPVLRLLPRPAVWGVGLVGLLLVDARWTTPGIAVDARLLPLCTTLTLVGSALLICLFAATPAASIGTFGPVGAVGRASFSLYLIHEPIVVSVGQAQWGLPLTALVAIALVIPATAAFHVAVERPTHRIAKRIAARDRGAYDGAVPRTDRAR